MLTLKKKKNNKTNKLAYVAGAERARREEQWTRSRW